MRNIKRAISVLMAAIMVMAMLAGCGGGSSFADQLRKAVGASESIYANKVASELVDVDKLTTTNVDSALTDAYGENYYFPSGNSVEMYSYAWDEYSDPWEGHYFLIRKYNNATEDEILRDVQSIDMEHLKTQCGTYWRNVYVYLAAKSVGSNYVVVIDVHYYGRN